jgi:hypothetical protein
LRLHWGRKERRMSYKEIEIPNWIARQDDQFSEKACTPCKR